MRSIPPVVPSWRTKLYFPMIVTTARLHLCDFDSGDVNPTTGEISPDKASTTEQNALLFEYPLPRHLQFTPGDVAEAYGEGLFDSFTRLHIILVVQSESFPEFLRVFWRDPTEDLPPG